MLANAVPAPLAEVIGRVIIARENGESIPEIKGRFGQWLHRRGLTKASIRNVKTRLNRARRLLDGRTFADAAQEIATIESLEAFNGLTVATRSDLRKALRLYREWQSEPKLQKRGSRKAEESVKVMAA